MQEHAAAHGLHTQSLPHHDPATLQQLAGHLVPTLHLAFSAPSEKQTAHEILEMVKQLQTLSLQEQLRFLL